MGIVPIVTGLVQRRMVRGGPLKGPRMRMLRRRTWRLISACATAIALSRVCVRSSLTVVHVSGSGVAWTGKSAPLHGWTGHHRRWRERRRRRAINATESSGWPGRACHRRRGRKGVRRHAGGGRTTASSVFLVLTGSRLHARITLIKIIHVITSWLAQLLGPLLLFLRRHHHIVRCPFTDGIHQVHHACSRSKHNRKGDETRAPNRGSCG